MAEPRGFQVDYSRLMARLKRGITELSGNAMQDVADYAAIKLESDSVQAFTRQAGPATGQRWKPSLRAKRQHGQTLLDTGRLRRGVRAEGTAKGRKATVVVGTVPIVYAAIHQFGGQAGRNRAVTLPARPYVGLRAQTIEKIRAFIRTRCTGALT